MKNVGCGLLACVVGLAGCHPRLDLRVPPDATYSPRQIVISIGAVQDERVDAAVVTPAFFASGSAIGMGRPVVSRDGGKDGGRVIVLSDEFWRQKLGASTQIIGSRAKVDGRDMVVVGIGAPTFRPQGAGLVWIAAAER